MKKIFYGKRRPQNPSAKKRTFRTPSRKNIGHRKKQQKGRPHQSPPLQGPESVLSRYNELLERHIRDRRKYFQCFHHRDNRKLKRLEDNFYSSAKRLHHYENSLNKEMKKWSGPHINVLKPDTTYSENHRLPRENSSPVNREESFDPHLLSSQREHSFKDDCEESMGTMDDYRKLKA